MEIPDVLRGLAVGEVGRDGHRAVVPCGTCHDGESPRPFPADAGAIGGPHVGLSVRHGAGTCGSCHHPSRRDALRLADGRTLPLTEAMVLCVQCHGPQGRDYARGAHGGMRGHWDLARGTRERNHCVSCHDPHDPRFGRFAPAPSPRDRFLPAPRERSHE